MKFLALFVMFASLNVFASEAVKVQENKAVSVNVEGLSSIKYRVVTNTWDDGCNSMGVSGVETKKLSKSGAKTAVIDVDVMIFQTVMGCDENAKPSKVTLETEWMEMKIKSAQEIIFIVGSDQTVEVQK